MLSKSTIPSGWILHIIPDIIYIVIPGQEIPDTGSKGFLVRHYVVYYVSTLILAQHYCVLTGHGDRN